MSQENLRSANYWVMLIPSVLLLICCGFAWNLNEKVSALGNDWNEKEQLAEGLQLSTQEDLKAITRQLSSISMSLRKVQASLVEQSSRDELVETVVKTIESQGAGITRDLAQIERRIGDLSKGIWGSQTINRPLVNPGIIQRLKDLEVQFRGMETYIRLIHGRVFTLPMD